jgi:histidinol dehydrogenase
MPPAYSYNRINCGSIAINWRYLKAIYMKIIKLDSISKNNILENLLKRSPNQYEEYTTKVNEIIEDVKVRKNEAIFDYTKRFDKADINADNIRVTDAEIEEAYS